MKGQRWDDFSIRTFRHRTQKFRIKLGNKIQYVQTLSQGPGGLILINLETKKKHYLPIAATSVSQSDDAFLITVTPKSIDNLAGFFILRYADLFRFGYQSPIPLFYMPLDPTLGEVLDVYKSLEENTIYVKTDNAVSRRYTLPADFINDFMKAQVLSYAIYQVAHNPEFKGLGKIVLRLRDRLKIFFTTLKDELKAHNQERNPVIPKRAFEMNLDTCTVEDVAKVLAQIDDHQDILAIKMKYAVILQNIINEFYAEYDALLNGINLDTALMPASQKKPAASAVTSPVGVTGAAGDKDIGWWYGLDGDEQSAIAILGGVGAVTLFITVILPRIVKKKLPVMVADSMKWYTKKVESSLIKWFAYKVAPDYFTANQSRVAKFVNGLGKTRKVYDGLEINKHHFKRAFWQTTGGTAASLWAEYKTRPLLAGPNDREADYAIFHTRPFSEMHVLWMQKNALYKFAKRQILWCLMSTLGVAILEKDREAILRDIVYETALRKSIGQQLGLSVLNQKFRFNASHRQKIGTMVMNDTKIMNNVVGRQAEHLILSGIERPTMADLQASIQPEMERLRNSWIESIEKMVDKERKTRGFRLNPAARQELATAMDSRLKTASQTSLEAYIKIRTADIGKVQKFFRAFGATFERALSRVMKKEWASGIGFWIHKTGRETWSTWNNTHKSYFYNASIVSLFTRGSINPTMIQFSRLQQLTFTTPLFVLTYNLFLRYIGFNTLAHNVAYGFCYGLVTHYIGNWIFIEIYEKRMRNQWYDFELSDLWRERQQKSDERHKDD